MKNLYTQLSDVTRDKRYTFTSEDVSVSGATLAVQSIVGFESLSTSSGQVLIVGKLGGERTELVRTSNTTGQSPSASYKWIYLRDTLQFDHPQDTEVTITDFDRVEIQWAASVNGTKATLFAYPFNITPDTPEMVNVDTSATAGYYFIRFNNTVNSQNSDWSDPIPYGGFDDNTVFSIKKRALDDLGEQIDDRITHEYLNQCLWEARREYHQAPGKRPFRRRFNVDVGNALTGSFRIDLPTDTERPHTAENVYGVRIGTNSNMTYYDKKEFDFDYRNKPHTLLSVAYAVNTDQDLYLTDVRDFSDSGSVTIEGTSIGYSARGISGGTLRISDHGDWSCSAGSDVWQNISLGLPNRFTVFGEPGGSAYIYFNRPIETSYVNQNIYADYYRTLVGYDSDADVLDEPKYDMFVDFLKAKIKQRRSKGTLDIAKDNDYLLWLKKKDDALNSEFVGADIRIQPDVSHLGFPD